MKSQDKIEFARLVSSLDILDLDPNWSGLDTIWPIVEKVQSEGAIVVIKADGERTGEDDTGRYTAIIGSGAIGTENIRVDRDAPDEALAACLLQYGKRSWFVA